MFRPLALCFLTLIPMGCVSSYSMRATSDDTLLGVQEREDGSSVTWRMNSGRGGAPKVEKTVTEQREIALLGIRSLAIGRVRAERYGINPWEGVWIDRVTSQSAASAAGIRPGDVLLKIAGVNLSSADQSSQVIELELEPGVPSTVTVMRFNDKGEAATTLLLDIVPKSRTVTDSATDSVALDSSSVVRELTGMSVGLIPADMAAEALGSPTSVVYVASVLAGSPAYMAGLRAGDRVLEIDGQSTNSLAPLVSAVLSRAAERHISVSTEEREMVVEPRSAKGPVGIRVVGPLGDYRTEMDVSGEIDEVGAIDIPIVFDCRTDVDSTRWSFLDFIFQFGANYRSSYLESSTREPAESTFFSMLPLGFFEVEKNPRRSRYCIFWVIEWESRN